MRPILSENCFHCHGPDANKREADLRLDVEADAKKDLGGYFALKSGSVEESEVWVRVATDDPDDLMPPPDSKRELTAKQKDLLKKWIASGAKYEAHWAYVPPVRPDAPKLADPALESRVRNEIDRFVFARLAEDQLSPAPEADRRALIRRVSFDLTGLPPTPEEVNAFLADESPRAWENVVDRLLKSDRFGEHWARPWLDLARYADSNGFQADQLRDSWAYRDWVIDALNADMPFDQFTIEQLAGDLLPNATLEQKIATGFHRTVTCNVEAGVHPEENRTNQIVDRVNTTGTVWLGTTLECCQCHDHKYDPFTMKDYYQVFAYFNNTPLEVQNPSGKGVSFDFYGPKMELPLEPDKASQREKLQKELASLQTERKAAETGTAKARTKWEAGLLASAGQSPKWEVLDDIEFSGREGESCQSLDDGSLLVTGEVPNTTSYTLKARTHLKGIRALRLEMLTHDSLPAKGPARGNGDRPNAIVTEAKLTATPVGKAASGKTEAVALQSARADFSQINWDVAGAIDGDPKTGWAINPKFGEDHWAVFETAEAIGSDNDETELTLTLDQNYGGGRVIGRLRVSVTDSDPSAEDIDPAIRAILEKPESKRKAKEKQQLDDLWSKTDPILKRLDLRILGVNKELKSIEPPSTLVMVEMDEARETHIMTRGNYLAPQEKVEPATPARLHPIDPALPKNRLGFAQWLMDRDNPLVARVTVNRWWARMFGHGIVRTVEDFGTQSDPPTHPQLLDWLAVEFMDSGWDMKHVLKEIVMSETYRLDSRMPPGQEEGDPENLLYARGPRFRLSAEMIRDNALTVSGLLSTKMHGPPIMPYQPPNIWRQVGRNEPKWVEAQDENRWRRGVYIVWRRAAPYPSFVNFDGPDRSACVVERPRTNTPLQALTLLNDPAYVEMAVALADRILHETPDADVATRLDKAFELVLSREIRESERATLTDLLERRLADYQADEEKAKAIIESARGWYRPKSGADTAELAAWFFVANTLLNLDETVTKS
ncbi:MAG: PSD1 domain-containing protein [Verrucomicrobiae bacterium]|nr:PSD1 domain-containing protein [Verrucomicrobiae bacterium]